MSWELLGEEGSGLASAHKFSNDPCDDNNVYAGGGAGDGDGDVGGGDADHE